METIVLKKIKVSNKYNDWSEWMWRHTESHFSQEAVVVTVLETVEFELPEGVTTKLNPYGQLGLVYEVDRDGKKWLGWLADDEENPTIGLNDRTELPLIRKRTIYPQD